MDDSFPAQFLIGREPAAERGTDSIMGKTFAETNAPWTDSGSPLLVRVTRDHPLFR